MTALRKPAPALVLEPIKFRLLLLGSALLLGPLAGAHAQTIIAFERVTPAPTRLLSSVSSLPLPAPRLQPSASNLPSLVASKPSEGGTVALTSNALDKKPLTDARILPALSGIEGSGSVSVTRVLTQAAESVLDSDHSLAFTDFALAPLPTMRLPY